MNPRTNELIDLEGLSEEERNEKSEQGFVPVPDELDRAARRKLNGKKSAQVSFTSGGNLSKWDKKVRENQEKGNQKNGY